MSQQILHFEEDSVQVHADLSRAHGVGVEPQSFHLLHNDALAFLGQTDEVVVVTEQDERLRKLESETKYKRKHKNTQFSFHFLDVSSTHLSQVEFEHVADVVRIQFRELHQVLAVLKSLAQLLHTRLGTIHAVDPLHSTKKQET